MEANELKSHLDLMVKGLEGKSSIEIKSAIEAFTKSNKELIDNSVKAVKDELELELKAIKDQAVLDIKAVQDHANILDVKLKSKNAVEAKSLSFQSKMGTILSDNFKDISAVRQGKSASISTKAVGDMTLANLTGDQPRDYSSTVIMTPSPLVNFTDLIGSPINISGGTYTFPQETGSEGAIATQTEGAAKGQIDYDFTMKDVATDYLAGTTTYSKKMSNNLPFLQSFIPLALRRDYIKQENTQFNTVLAAAALASTQIITGKTKIQMLMNECARLEDLDNPVNGIVVKPSDWWTIAQTETTGGGFNLPQTVTFTEGRLFINGIPVYKATWLAANKYYVGDWTRLKKVVTEGLSLEFSNENKDNFEKNNVTARIEAQIALAYERDTAIILGDFTATA
tara:strand:- start:2047 stop:3237 length:1191 start_codon:yes stop_codon:yes gene_type:complete